MVQAVVQGRSERPARACHLDAASLASCLRRIGERALFRARGPAEPARQAFRGPEQARARVAGSEARGRGGQSEAAQGRGRGAGGGVLRKPGPIRGKPQRIVEAERLHRGAASAGDYSFRLHP